MSAVLSDCGRYRYRLGRTIQALDVDTRRIALFVMLNPSTADALADDPTIRRCLGFARRERCGRLEVVNLYAFRATDPADLATAVDPIGPENGSAIGAALCETVGSGGIVIAAWGASGPPRTLDLAVRFGLLADYAGAHLHCLGVTKNGNPRHPLFVRRDAPLVRWT